MSYVEDVPGLERRLTLLTLTETPPASMWPVFAATVTRSHRPGSAGSSSPPRSCPPSPAPTPTSTSCADPGSLRSRGSTTVRGVHHLQPDHPTR